MKMSRTQIDQFSKKLEKIHGITRDKMGSEGSDILLLFSKKGRRNSKTIFKYYKAAHQGEARKTFEDILKNNLKEALESEYSDDFASENPTALIKMDLNTINMWEDYEKGIIENHNHDLENLKMLKSQLNNYILAYKDKNFTIGQIRRITPKKVLADNHVQKAQYNGNTFDSITIESDSVEIDDEFDVFFIITPEEKIGLIKDRDMFVDIFDLDEETKNNAINTLESSPIIDFCPESTEIMEIVETDRNIQYMLRNNLTSDGLTSIQLDDLNLIKSKLKDNVTFNIIDNQIMLDSKNKKQSVKDLIKAAGYHFNQSLYNEAIIEGIPQKRIS